MSPGMNAARSMDVSALIEYRKGYILARAQDVSNGFLTPADAIQKMAREGVTRSEMLDLLADREFKAGLETSLKGSFSDFINIPN
jgi:hypothetical protein